MTQVTLVLAAFCCCRAACAADPTAACRAPINYIAAALTAGNSSDAMTPFSKSFPDRATLQNYFSSLTSAYNISSEVDFVDEDDSAAECKLNVRWAITLSDLQSNATSRRVGEIKFRLVPEKGKWRITAMDPTTLFNLNVNAQSQ